MKDQFSSLNQFGNIFVLITILFFLLQWMRVFFLNLCLQLSNRELYRKVSQALVFSSLGSYKQEGSGEVLDKFSQ